jgi:hypothetical protein
VPSRIAHGSESQAEGGLPKHQRRPPAAGSGDMERARRLLGPGGQAAGLG